MRLFEISTPHIFDQSKTGKPKYDDMISNPEKYPNVTTDVKTMSPQKAMAMMAKGQNRTVKQVVDRRMKMGAKEKIKSIVKDLKSGIKYDIPTLFYDNGGFMQDGYHRLMAADAMGIDSVPIRIFQRR